MLINHQIIFKSVMMMLFISEYSFPMSFYFFLLVSSFSLILLFYSSSRISDVFTDTLQGQTRSKLELHKNSCVTSIPSVFMSKVAVYILTSSDRLLARQVLLGTHNNSLSSLSGRSTAFSLEAASITFTLMVSLSSSSRLFRQMLSSCSVILAYPCWQSTSPFLGDLSCTCMSMDWGGKLTSNSLRICWKLMGLSLQYRYFLWRERQLIFKQQLISVKKELYEYNSICSWKIPKYLHHLPASHLPNRILLPCRSINIISTFVQKGQLGLIPQSHIQQRNHRYLNRSLKMMIKQMNCVSICKSFLLYECFFSMENMFKQLFSLRRLKSSQQSDCADDMWIFGIFRKENN